MYGTEEERFYPLPPPINPARKPTLHDKETADKIRSEYVKDRSILLLAVASAFKTKGIDRIIHGLHHLPEALKAKVQLLVAGGDNSKSLQRQIADYQLDDQIDFVGAVDTIVPLYLAADLFVHPARLENTGTVLLEAMLAGLPILTTANCGYAEYVQVSQSGRVLEEPFSQEAFNQALLDMLSETSEKRAELGGNGKAYADEADFFSMPQKAMGLIEDVAKQA